MSENNRADWLAQTGARAATRLSEILSRLSPPPELHNAMRHAVLGGGKRLRPLMTIIVGGESQTALDAACALECIHCYSLAHDDLPCMDNSDTRRGAPACHAKHGEAMALLAGDCLHSLAFEILADCNLPPAALRILAQAAGAEGMGGGQALDLQATAENESSLRKMHELKTGALFNCALQLGLLCRDGELPQKESRRLQTFAAAFGRLFQIANDIRDAAADSALGKTTYCTVLGPATAKQRAQESRDEAIAALDGGHPRLADLARRIFDGIR